MTMIWLNFKIFSVLKLQDAKLKETRNAEDAGYNGAIIYSGYELSRSSGHWARCS